MNTPTNPIAWDLSLAYCMVRQRDHALTDRQRSLQDERDRLAKQLIEFRARIDKLGDAIATVEKAGGNADSLRAQIKGAHAEVRRIEPRHKYLETATSLLAANLRLFNQAHDALHWLRFENGKLIDFEKQAEVHKSMVDPFSEYNTTKYLYLQNGDSNG